MGLNIVNSICSWLENFWQFLCSKNLQLEKIFSNHFSLILCCENWEQIFWSDWSLNIWLHKSQKSRALYQTGPQLKRVLELSAAHRKTFVILKVLLNSWFGLSLWSTLSMVHCVLPLPSFYLSFHIYTKALCSLVYWLWVRRKEWAKNVKVQFPDLLK